MTKDVKDLDKKGFTLIELLVVIAIIGLLSTLAVVALNSARQKSRDAKRVADVSAIQTALELYFSDASLYPTQAAAVTLGSANYKTLSSGVALNAGFAATASGTTYMGQVPVAPLPAETLAACQAANANDYRYTSANGSTYSITFCIGGKVGDLAAGVHTASPIGIQ